MTGTDLQNTVDITWRPDWNQWSVEGGNGVPAGEGIHSLHDARADALSTAFALATEYDAKVRILEEPGGEDSEDQTNVVDGRTS